MPGGLSGVAAHGLPSTRSELYSATIDRDTCLRGAGVFDHLLGEEEVVRAVRRGLPARRRVLPLEQEDEAVHGAAATQSAWRPHAHTRMTGCGKPLHQLSPPARVPPLVCERRVNTNQAIAGLQELECAANPRAGSGWCAQTTVPQRSQAFGGKVKQLLGLDSFDADLSDQLGHDPRVGLDGAPARRRAAAADGEEPQPHTSERAGAGARGRMPGMGEFGARSFT